MTGSERVTGGCQCGAVRFVASAAPIRASVCHCRMCQRAVGNVVAPLVEFARDAVTWERGAPALFASSNVAERGFCAACGTPLFLRDIGGDTIELMIGALDRPDAFSPAYCYGVESRVGWLDGMPGLPGYETGAGPRGPERRPADRQPAGGDGAERIEIRPGRDGRKEE